MTEEIGREHSDELRILAARLDARMGALGRRLEMFHLPTAGEDEADDAEESSARVAAGSA